MISRISVNPYRAGIEFSHQNLTSLDPSSVRVDKKNIFIVKYCLKLTCCIYTGGYFDRGSITKNIMALVWICLGFFLVYLCKLSIYVNSISRKYAQSIIFLIINTVHRTTNFWSFVTIGHAQNQIKLLSICNKLNKDTRISCICFPETC